ncbi:MAG: hypothetical protein CL828_02555, partial [Crocinitomicaceae bacterium]|nr:hypothetical protein [Crocinitomicaceae bacterium]
MRNLLLSALGVILTLPALADAVGVEAEVHLTSEYGTTYRVYINFDSPDDELVAIYGTVGENQNAPLSVLTTTTFFQEPVASVDYGPDVNASLLPFFPDLVYDSWFTIGSEDNTGTGGLSAVGMESYLSGFNTSNGFTVDTFTGASWFVIPGTSADAIAGDDNRVLVAQLTTDGIVTVVLNAQYDDASGNTSSVIGLTATFPELAAGCTDSAACNYDSSAEADDGSCVFPGDACDDGNSLTINDAYTGSCVCAGEAIIEGCTSAEACNYNDAANTNDDSCFFVGDTCDDGDASTSGDAIGDDCQCSGQDIVFGCTETAACNYDSNAEVLDGSCFYPGDACDDGFSNTIDDEYQSDCTCSGTLVPTGPAGLEVEEYATSEYGTTYRVYATFDAPTNELIAVYGTVSETQNAPLSVVTTTSFFNPELGANFGEDINPAFFTAFPEIEYDSWFTIGT